MKLKDLIYLMAIDTQITIWMGNGEVFYFNRKNDNPYTALESILENEVLFFEAEGNKKISIYL